MAKPTIHFNYISASPGAGKTTWAISSTKKVLLTNPVMFIVPTIALCNEIENNSNGAIRAIHSEKYQDQPISDVIQMTMSSVAKTHINEAIVITDAAFSQLKYRHSNWVVYKDEPKEPLQISVINMTDTYSLFLQFFELKPYDNSNFYKLSLRPDRPFKLTTERDDVSRVIYELQTYVEQMSYYEVLVDRDCWDTQHILRYSVFQLPECYADFGDVTFMGANFEDTLLYNQWKNMGVSWNNRTPSKFGDIPSERMTIKYLFDDIQWSDVTRNKIHSGKSNLDWYVEWIATELPHNNYVWVANNKYDSRRLGLTGERMPAECHGLNRWRHVSNCVLLGSYLQYHGDEMFYQHYGTSVTDIRGMRNTQFYIQQLTRTSIRNYSEDTPVNVWVPTKREALDILAYFTGATISDPFDNQYRLRDSWTRARRDEEVMTPINAISIGPHVRSSPALITDEDIAKVEMISLPRATKPLDLKSGDRKLAYLLKIGSEYTETTFTGSRADLIKHFKANAPYFTPGVFPNGASPKSGAAICCTLLGFDFDDTKLTYSDIAEILGSTEHLIYTTISHTIAKPKFRVVVPLNRPVSISEHERLMVYFEFKFAQTKKGGLDPVTLKAERKFFLPHKEAQVHWVKTRKNPLDVDRLLLRIPRLSILSDIKDSDLRKLGETETEYTARAFVNISRKIDDLISQLSPGNRSTLSTRIAGYISMLPPERDAEYLNRLRERGVAPDAMASVTRYIRDNRSKK